MPFKMMGIFLRRAVNNSTYQNVKSVFTESLRHAVLREESRFSTQKGGLT